MWAFYCFKDGFEEMKAADIVTIVGWGGVADLPWAIDSE